MSITTYATLKTAIDAEGKWSGAFDSLIPEWVERSEDWIFTYPEFRIRPMEKVTDITVKASLSPTLGGTADALTLTNDTPKTSNTVGDTYAFTVASTNTGAVTVDVDGLGAVAIKQGFSASDALAPGDLIAGSSANIYFDGTQFVLVPPGAAALPSDYLATRRLILPTTPVRQLDYMDPINYWSKYVSSETSKPKAYAIEGDYILFGPKADATYAVKMLYYRRFPALSADADTNWILSNARGLYFHRALAFAYEYTGEPGKMAMHQGEADNLILQVIDANKRDRHSGAALVQRSDVMGP